MCVPLLGSYAATVLCGHVLYRVITALVVQERKFLFVRRRPAAGPVADLILAALFLEPRPRHVLHGDVIVLPVGRAFAAAVAQQNSLVAVVSEAQFANCQLQLPQRARLWPPGPFSPPRLRLTRTLTRPSFPVEQSPDHMLKLALREALEHHGN